MIEFIRQADLVAGRAELGGLMKRLQKRLLMEGRFRLHELIVDELQDPRNWYATGPKEGAKYFAPKSVEVWSGMWHCAQFVFAFSG